MNVKKVRSYQVILVPLAALLLVGCAHRQSSQKSVPSVVVPVLQVAEIVQSPFKPLQSVPAKVVTMSKISDVQDVAKVADIWVQPKQKIGLNFGAFAARLAALTTPRIRLPGKTVATAQTVLVACDKKMTEVIPQRPSNAPEGSELVKQIMGLSGPTRDAVVTEQLLAGNVPSFMRNLVPVSFSGRTDTGHTIQITICVTPDYLAVGDDRDFVRVPMGLPGAAEIADKFDFLLPTTKMVDAIYAQAGIHLSPSPMQASKQMSSTSYLWEHNLTVEGQRSAVTRKLDMLLAGQKKDLVLSNVLRSAPGRVAIYGWHRSNDAPIQPLSTVHGARYADYSHGIRLVSETAFVNGKARVLADLLQDPKMAAILSKEGPIADPRLLMASLYSR